MEKGVNCGTILEQSVPSTFKARKNIAHVADKLEIYANTPCADERDRHHLTQSHLVAKLYRKC